MDQDQHSTASPLAHERRVAALNDLLILDSEPEEAFDDIVMLATQICKTPVALVSLVAADRQWFKAKLGFPRCETPLNQSVCALAIEQENTFIIPDLAADPRTKDNTLVTEDPKIRFYAGAVLRSRGGVPIGTVCVIDTVPRPDGLSLEQQRALEALARQTAALLNMRKTLLWQNERSLEQLAESAEELYGERKLGQLREQFMAILGHDLRNPIAAINAGLELLRRTPLDERGRRLAVMMGQSTARMNELVANMLDFARTQLGGGISALRKADAPIGPILEHTIDELRLRWPDCRIIADIQLTQPVNCDVDRLSQLLSNLLSNACIYGEPHQPIGIVIRSGDGQFEIKVSNRGTPIPPENFQLLFQPFSRAAAPDRDGLGLGLHIASEIAKSHGGGLTVSSSVVETVFTFSMPLV